MDTLLLKIKTGIDRLNKWIGEMVSWFSLLLVLLVCFNVVMRYVFNISLKWENELEWHVFSLLFLLAGGYTLLENKHVRVDVFYTKFSAKNRALTELIGTLAFLLPWASIILYYSFLYFWDSFLLKEGSPDPGGLKAWYWGKLAIFLGFFLLVLQGISTFIKAYLALKSGDFSHYEESVESHSFTDNA